MSNTENDEKIGKAIVNIRWFIFAAKFIIVVSLIALAILYFLERPLWIAPIIGVCLFMVYRLIWRLICRFIGWVAKQ